MSKIICLLAVLFSACYFHPSGDNFKKITPPDFKGMSIDLNNASDTLYMYQSTQLFYSSITASYTLVKVTATLNGNEIFSSSNSSSGSFYLNPSVYGTGTYSLKIILTVDSGSGSLKDKTEGEQAQVWRTFTVIIDRDYPPAPNVTLDTTGGTMTVSWNKYTKWNFNYYTVTKSGYVNGNYQIFATQTFNSRTQTSWRDSAYVGGYAQYGVSVTASDLTNEGVQLYSWFPKVRFEMKDKTAIIHWQRCVFHQNTIGQTMQIGNQAIVALSPNDSTYQTPAPASLGQVGEWQVTFKSKSPMNNYLLGDDYYRGTRTNSSVLLDAYNPKDDLYYGFMSYSYVAMDSLLNYKAAMQQGTTALSADGSHMITFRSDSWTTPTFYEVNPVTMEVSNPKQVTYVANTLSVSNNGLVAMSTYYFNRVCTWPDLNVVYENDSFVWGIVMISSSGQYLLESNNLYNYNGTTFQLVGPINSSSLVRAAFTETDNLILGYDDGKIVILDGSLHIINTISTPVTSMEVLRYDPVSKRILVGASATGFYVVDPQSGTAQKISPYNTILLNGKLFCNGYEIDYNQF